MTSSADEALRAYLAAHLTELGDDLARLLKERIPFYRAIPDESLRAATLRWMRVFVENAAPTWDLTSLIAWGLQTLEARVQQGLDLPSALRLSSCFRSAVLRAVVPLLDAKEARIEGLPRLLIFVDEYCDKVIDDVTRHFTEALESAQRSLSESEARYRGLVEFSPDGMVVFREGRILYVNREASRIMGPEARVGGSIFDLAPPEQRDQVRAAGRAAEQAPERVTRSEVVTRGADGESIIVEAVGVSILYEGSPARQVIFRDITERKRAAAQEQLILAQEARLRELLTPLIPVSDGVVVMPLVGVIDRARAEQIRQVLLDGISAAGAQVAILDVTGVPTVDGGVAEALLSAVAAARLLGAEVVLTGIKPAAARALVELGVDFGRIVTRATLKDGIGHALARAR